MAGPEVWLVRHGETEWSRDHKHTSSTDLPLTPVGVAAAQALRERLSGVDFDRVFTSPLRRARETARLAGFPGAEAVPDAVEWQYGEIEGVTTADYRRTRPDWFIWRDGAPGGESPDDVAARCDRVLAMVRAEVDGRALLVAHGHLLRVLAARWVQQPPAAGAHYRLDTATVSVLGWERETPVLLRWNA